MTMLRVLYASIWTLTLASDNFDKFHNDILSKISNNLRKLDSDISDAEKIEVTKQIEPQRLDFRLEATDHNEKPKIDVQIVPSLNIQAPQKGEPMVHNRRINKPYVRMMGNKKTKVIVRNDVGIKPVMVNNTRNFPYIAAIIINGRLWCAGSLVDENWVLTAAHCLNYVLHVSPLKSLGAYVKVRVGSVAPHEGGTVIDVVGAVRHPRFEEEPVPHADVALLKLAHNVDLNSQVNIINIYDGKEEPYPQSFVVVSGWGATSGAETSFREHTPNLGSGRLKVRSQKYCSDAYQLVNGFQFTPDLFCASLRNGSRDLCLFDAGAPAVQQNRLMGIMSFGPERCGHEFQPAVFIKAFYFKDFVKSTISSYKTTQELIHAIQEIDPSLQENRKTEKPTTRDTDTEEDDTFHSMISD